MDTHTNERDAAEKAVRSILSSMGLGSVATVGDLSRLIAAREEARATLLVVDEIAKASAAIEHELATANDREEIARLEVVREGRRAQVRAATEVATVAALKLARAMRDVCDAAQASNPSRARKGKRN
jgi:alkylated DNA nucleotide flippase Atl1